MAKLVIGRQKDLSTRLAVKGDKRIMVKEGEAWNCKIS